MYKQIALCALAACAFAVPARAQLQKNYYIQEGVEIRGVMPTENVTSLEINPSFTVIDDAANTTLNQLTLKAYNAFNANWNGGIEVPLARFGSGDYSADGLGDVTLSASYVRPLADERLSYGVTSDLVLPSASHDELGTGKVQLAPAVFGVYKPASNFFVSLGYRQWVSVAGDGGREDINRGRIRSVLAYLSDAKWWALLDLRYIMDYRDWGRAEFAPEAEIGSMINSGTSAYIRVGGHMAGNIDGNDCTVSIGFKVLHL